MMNIIKIIRAKLEYILVRTGFLITILIKLKCRLPFLNRKKIVKINSLSDNIEKIKYNNIPSNSHIKSLVIFAAYFPNGIIPEYTIYYLKKLKEIFDGIILISDSSLSQTEISKIKDLIIYCECSKHYEYDFGSYKRGYNIAKDANLLNNLKYLLLCNDSVVGPVFNLNNIFKKMMGKADFWGLMESEEIRYHLQSWFICFENNKLITNEIGTFLNTVKKEKYFWDVVLNYETKFTKFFLKKGYKCISYTPCKIKEIKKLETLNHSSNKVFYPLFMMQKYNFPFVKVKFLNGDYIKNVTDSKEDTINYIKQNNKELYITIQKRFC